MKILFIFLLGIGILVGAIVLNYLASLLGLISWYEFLKDPKKAEFFSYIWLFIIYPLSLGLIGYGMVKLLNLN